MRTPLPLAKGMDHRKHIGTTRGGGIGSNGTVTHGRIGDTTSSCM
jgi:hypothetical protein